MTETSGDNKQRTPPPPYGHEQGQELQQGQHGGGGQRQGGRALPGHQGPQEAGQGQGQEHPAAQQHVQEGAEGWAGEGLHRRLALHLEDIGETRRDQVRRERHSVQKV